jgi:eukaryotic-like serine/threonine-protein kinase
VGDSLKHEGKVITLSQSNSAGQSQAWLGRTIGDQGRYRLEQRLGGGGMGEVFLATDMRLGKPVALKLLKESLAIAEDPDLQSDLQARFEQECSICAALKSQHIVQVSDYGLTSEGYPFYVMEYLQGQTLGEYLEQQPHPDVAQTVNIISQVCAGLELAHTGIALWTGEDSHGETIKVIHRDLKPANIFLIPTALGQFVKIIDFGIAKIRSLQSEYTSDTAVFMGTCHYAAPEQFDIRAEVDERTDIYSLGVILYEMLAGVDPFGLNFRQARISNELWLKSHATKAPIPLRSHPNCATLPPALEAVVMRSLAKSPGDRFPNIQSFNQALTQALTSQPSQTSQSSPTSRSSPTSPPIASSAETQRAVQTSLPWKLIATGLLLTLALGIGIPQLARRFNTASNTTIAALNTQGLTLKQDLQKPAAVWAVAIAPDGQSLFSGTENGLIEIKNLESGQDRKLAENIGAVRSLALSQDGQTIAAGSGDNSIEIWRLKNPNAPQVLSEHKGPVWSVALSSDGQTLVSGSDDRTIRVWDLRSGNSRTLDGHSDRVYTVALSPDGKTIASGSADRTVKFWDLATGSLIRTLSEPGGHRDAVRAIAFSPNGQQFASASWDKTIKLWNPQTGEVLHSLEGHRDRVVAIAYSADSKTVVTASLDRTIKLWSTETGQLLRTLEGHQDWVLALAVSPKNQAIASGSKDQTIKVWQ